MRSEVPAPDGAIEMRAAGASVAQRIIMTLTACATSHGPMTLTDIIEETGLPKSTAHRTCWKLVDLGLLEHSPEGFVVGIEMFAMGLSNPLINRIRVAAMPVLLELHTSTGVMANLAILHKGRALVIDALYASQPELPRLVGASLPLHCTAVGKAIAATFEAPEQHELIGELALPPATWRTIVRPNLLREHLIRVAEEGIAVSNEEFMPGIYGAAAAVRGPEVTVAVGLVGASGSAAARRLSAPVRYGAAALQAELA